MRPIFTKAYYNWLSLHPEKVTAPWEVEDYRELSSATLFERLNELGLPLSEENFLLLAETSHSPEELTQSVCPQDENKGPIYLILFELWRRLLPEKETLSIVCDELDYRIHFYPSEDKNISNILERIIEILEESDQDPKAAFLTICAHVGHDLEPFLFDYISDQLDAHSELIKSFYPFISDPIWFDFLQARLLIEIDSHEGNIAFTELLKKLEEAPDLDLILEMAAFLVHHADPILFQKTCQLSVDYLETEEDFQELLAIVADYCHFVEKDDDEEQLQARFTKRQDIPLDRPIDSNDPDLLLLGEILKNAEWFKI